MKQELISRLKKDILLWQGYKSQDDNVNKKLGLGKIETAFPNGIFPKGAIHEFIGIKSEHSAPSIGFIASLLSVLLNEDDVCLWIGTIRKLFPVSLQMFNVNPEQIIFIDVTSEKEALWVTEEALKCEGVNTVITEVNNLNLIESRRLQLAVEKSGVNCFVLRKGHMKTLTSLVSARWKISSIPSKTSEGLPGIGFPRWNVELVKVRNGNPTSWIFEWSGDKLIEIPSSFQKKDEWFNLHKEQLG